MKIGTTVPIFRIFDVDKALAHYVGFLGFNVDWEHRFEDGMPLYMQVSRGDCVLHLTEHHGDCTPGARARVIVEDLAAFHAEISAKDYPYANPGLDEMPWGERVVQVGDPFGNRLTFYEPIG